MATTRLNDRTGFVGAWVDPDLIRRLDERAHQQERTRSAEIRLALRRHVEREQTAPTAGHTT
jgi:predicted transcriptional regulator